jgi:hypothetical protein
VADYSDLTDVELMERYNLVKHEQLPLISDPDDRRELWAVINGLSAEIHRRYPPVTTPI